VQSILFLTSGIGQQSTSGFSWRAVPDVTGKGVEVARIVEVDKLLQALDVTM